MRAHTNGRTLGRLVAVVAIAAGVVVTSSSAVHAAVSMPTGPSVVHDLDLPGPVGGQQETTDDWSWT